MRVQRQIPPGHKGISGPRRFFTPKAVRVDVSGQRMGSTRESLHELLKIALIVGAAALVCGLFLLFAVELLFSVALSGASAALSGAGGPAVGSAQWRVGMAMVLGAVVLALLALLVALLALTLAVTHLIGAGRLRTPASALVAASVLILLVSAGVGVARIHTSPRFSTGEGIATDRLGNVYVADKDGERIVKLSPDGTVLATFATDVFPVNVAVDNQGDIFVTDVYGADIQELSPQGRLIAELSIDPNNPKPMAVDQHGIVYIGTDQLLEKRTATGKVLDRWDIGSAINALAIDRTGRVYLTLSGDDNHIQQYSPQGKLLRVINAKGSYPGRAGLSVDTWGHVYVTDTQHGRIVEFSSAGRHLRTWRAGPFTSDRTNYPSAVAVDQRGQVYVTTGSKLQKFSRTGRLLAEWD